MAKKECFASIAVDGRIDVRFEIDEGATKEEIKKLAMEAFWDVSLENMECIDSTPVNYEIDGKLTDF